MPGVGILFQALRIDSPEKQQTIEEAAAPFRIPYAGWLDVRNATGSGYGGYFSGLNWTNDRIQEYLNAMSDQMVNSIFRNDGGKAVLECARILAGELPWNISAIRIISGVFGSSLGRLRTLAYDRNVIADGDRRKVFMHQDAFRRETIDRVTPLEVEDIWSEDPQRFGIRYELREHRDVSVHITPITHFHHEKEILLEKAGMIGMPALRAVMATYEPKLFTAQTYRGWGVSLTPNSKLDNITSNSLR